MAYSSYKTLTLAASQSGSNDSADWPLGIILDGNVHAADPDLKTVSNGGYVENVNGYDIRPFSDSTLSTPLRFELVTYDASSGKLEMWVKIPVLSHTSDTTIVLAFGNPLISLNGSDAANTFSRNYQSIWHFKDSSSLGTDSLNYHNSTTTVQGSPTNPSGALGNGLGLNGTSQRIDIAAWGHPASTAEITVSAWVFAQDFNSYIAIWSHFFSGTEAEQFAISNVGTLYWQVHGSTDVVTTGGTTLALNTWYYVTATYKSGVGGAVYYNAQPVDGTNATSVGNLTTTSLKTNIGAINDVSNLFKGTMDELRVAYEARSAAWITAEYNAQKPSSSFITWGTRQVASGTYVLAVSGGSVVLTGTDSAMRASRRVTASAGNYSATGGAAGVRVGRVVAAATGSYSTTGMTTALRFGRVLAASASTYAVSGSATAFAAARHVAAGSGTLTCAGVATGVRIGRAVVVTSGAYGLSGVTASLLYSGAHSTYTLTAAGGSYASAGTATAFRYARVLPVTAGTYAGAGTTTRLAATRVLVSGSAAYTGAGTSTGVAYGRRLVAGPAGFALTGGPSTLRAGRALQPIAGSYLYSGTAASLFTHTADHDLVTTTFRITRLVSMTSER